VETERFAGDIKSATVSRMADRWFVSITVDTNDQLPVRTENQGAVGVVTAVKPASRKQEISPIATYG